MKLQDLEKKRKEREQKKKKVRKQQYLKIFIILAIIVVIAFTLKRLTVLDIFTVKNISIAGISRLTEEEILELAKISPKASIFNVNPKEIEDRVASSPWIKEAKLVKSFPNSVKVQIEEEQPVLAVKNKDGYWLVSDDAIALEQPEKLPNKFPLIAFKKSDFIVELGYKIENKKVLSLVRIYTSMEPDVKKRIKTGSVSGDDLYFIDEKDIQIVYGDTTDLEEKNLLISQLLKDIDKKKTDVYYIDIRVPSKPAIKKVPTSVEIRDDF